MKTAASFLCALFLVLSTLPAQAASPKGVLIVAFGTSMASAMPSLEAIDKAYKGAYKGQPVVWAYTSDIIRKKLAKEGRKVFSVNEAMNECARLGIADLRVQPLHAAQQLGHRETDAGLDVGGLRGQDVLVRLDRTVQVARVQGLLGRAVSALRNGLIKLAVVQTGEGAWLVDDS